MKTPPIWHFLRHFGVLGNVVEVLGELVSGPIFVVVGAIFVIKHKFGASDQVQIHHCGIVTIYM